MCLIFDVCVYDIFFTGNLSPSGDSWQSGAGEQKGGFPDGSEGKEFACDAGDTGLVPELGRSSTEGSGYPFQYSRLENSIDRGNQWATAHGEQRVRHD